MRTDKSSIDLYFGGLNGTDHCVCVGEMIPTTATLVFPTLRLKPAALGVTSERPFRWIAPSGHPGVMFNQPTQSRAISLGPIRMRFSIPGTERFNVSIASEHYLGNESFTGIGCETGHEADILAGAPDGAMQDVSVYLWPDDNADGYPDAYTVSTGTIVVAEDGTASVPTPGSKWAAVCSSVGPEICGNPRAPVTATSSVM